MRKILGLLFVFMMFLNSFPAFSQEKPAFETVGQAVERMAQQAKVDRKKIPIYAITKEALDDTDNEFPNMPPALIAAARNRGQSVVVGKSTVSINWRSGVATFVITPSATSVIAAGSFTHTWRPDLVDEVLAWLYESSTSGQIFVKGKKSMVAVPSYESCLGFPMFSSSPEDESEEVRQSWRNLAKVCERFGLGHEPKARKTSQDMEDEDQFLAELVKKYGNDGVLTRRALHAVGDKHHALLMQSIMETDSTAGYVKYNPATDKYELQIPATRQGIGRN